MKKPLAILFVIAALCVAANARAQLVFTNQTITVLPSQLSVESVEFYPLAIVTHRVAAWVESVTISTNGVIRGGGVVTNAGQTQVFNTVVSTNAASWIVNVIFALPAGHQWELNRFPVTVERFKTRLQIPVEPSAVRSLFGSAAAGLEFAAQNGAYQPTGQVRDGFLALAAGVLAGEGE